jgi:putative aldouronate transport system permease protein
MEWHMTAKFNFSTLVLHAIMLLILIVTLYPFVYILAISFSDGLSVMQNKVVLIPVNFNLSAYKAVFSNNNVLGALNNSVLYTVLGTLLSVLFTMITAYPLAKEHLAGKKLFMIMIVITMVFATGMIPFFLVVKNLGLLNTIWAVILPFLISPWNVILTRVFIENIPKEIEHAAMIDGCNDIKYLYRIVIPLCVPIIATISLYYAVSYWNMYFWPMMFLNEKEMYPIQVLLQQMVIMGSMASELSKAGPKEIGIAENIKAATIMVSTVPILLVYPFLQKYFVKGIMIGAVKG